MDQSYKIKKAQFADFLDTLRSYGTVHAPVRVSDQSFSFKAIRYASDIAFDALRTILPPKKFFYPQHETLIEYTGSEVREVLPPPEKIVLFGVHPCDLSGLQMLDKIFCAPPADTHYRVRRENCLIVGLSCMPDKHCFCQSMGTDKVEEGYDIFLTDTGDYYFVQVHTTRGVALLENCQFLLPVDDSDIAAYNRFWAVRADSFQIGFSDSNLAKTMEVNADHPIWEELGNRCLSCGNCVPVCPTCYCFDVLDIASLDGESGTRQREWDACQIVSFANTAGGHNFRPGPVDRLKFWYQHKLHGFDDAAATRTCVGCGRCTVSCPSGIDDIVQVVLTIQGNSVKLNEKNNQS